MKRFALLVGLLAVVLGAGCSSHLSPSGLQVSLLRLDRAPDGSLVGTLEFENASVQAYNIASSRHELVLNGRPVGRFVVTEPLGLPAERAAKQAATLELKGAAPAAGAATYELSSEMILQLYGDEKEKFKTRQTGSVTVP